MENNQTLPKLQVKHLVYLGIFLLALGLRLFAAGRLAITQPEADILLRLTRDGLASSSRGSLLYQLLTLPLMDLFGSGRLVVRFWLIFAGAVLTLVPLLFEDWIGEKPALILSALFALDPFGSAASLQLNSSLLTLCTLFVSLGLFHRGKYFSGVLVFLIFMLSGRAVLYPLGLGLIFALVLYLQKETNSIKRLFLAIRQSIGENIRTILIVLVGLVLVLFLLQIPLSDSLNDIFAMFTNWGQPYALGSSPQLFPIALVSYVPLGILCLLFPAHSVEGRKLFPYLFLISLLALILVTVNPGHQVLDLVWVSSPLWVIAAINLSTLMDQLKTYLSSMKIKIYTLIVVCLLVSLSLTVAMLIYQIQYGLDLVGNLLSTISLFAMIAMVVLFMAYNDTVPLALTALRCGLILVVLVFQIAFSWRSLGLNGNPAGEILWNGYFEGAQTVEDIIWNANLDRTGSGLDMSVGLINPSNGAVEWEISQKFKVEELESVTTDQRLAVLITDSRDGLNSGSADGYYGQDFNATSYPLWIWQPGKNLSDMDFWFWLIFRQGQMMRETNFVWVNKTLFTNTF